jgi:ribosomal protein S26
MEVIIEWHRVQYICLSLTHLNVHIDKGSIHVKVCRNTSRTFPHSWLVARITRRVPLVEQKLLTLPEDMSSPPVFSVVRVTRSLVLCVCFADRCLSFCTFFFWSLCCLFFFDIRIMVASLWYLQTLLIEYI